MSAVHDRAFAKRLADARRKLRMQNGELRWVEAVDTRTGAALFFFTDKAALTGPASRELRFERPNCENCHQPWADHAPSGGQCLFGATSYDHVL